MIVQQITLFIFINILVTIANINKSNQKCAIGDRPLLQVHWGRFSLALFGDKENRPHCHLIEPKRTVPIVILEDEVGAEFGMAGAESLGAVKAHYHH